MRAVAHPRPDPRRPLGVMRRLGHTLALGGLLVSASCGSGGTTAPPPPPPPPPPPSPVVASVTIWPATVAPGGTVPRNAVAKAADGQVVNVSGIVWTSDNPAIATVSSSGVVTGVVAGQTTIHARSGNQTGDAAITVASLDFATFTSYSSTACGVTTGGLLYCWGTSLSAGPQQSPSDVETCGPPDAPSRQSACFSTPRKFPTSLVFTALASGYDYACGLTAAGDAWCWGANSGGQLGAPTTDTCGQMPCSLTPVPVSDGHQFVAIKAAASTTCGLTALGEAWCWGTNENGKLGSPLIPGAQSITPVRAAPGRNFRVLSIGYSSACGIELDGVTYCWGDNSLGTVGSNRLSGSRVTPVDGGLTFTSIAVGYEVACGLTAVGSAYCWGGNSNGTLGIGSFWDAGRVTYTPVAVTGNHVFTQLTSGLFFTCGLDTAGTPWCWGVDGNGNLGLGTDVAPDVCGDRRCISDPLAVNTTLKFTSLQAGDFLTCGLTAVRVEYCWGRNGVGQAGVGITDGADRRSPKGVGGTP